MTRLVHLTDLHFGLHRAELVQPLCDAVRASMPDVVVVSGDLTQRALHRQYAAAMTFVRSLGSVFLVIPGNHDLPVFNPLTRLLNPFGPFRRGAANDLAPRMDIGRLRLFGANTADSFRWRGGLMRDDQIDRICLDMQDGPADAVNILLCHHPLEDPPGFLRGETRGSAAALDRLRGAGLHVTLSGHLHHWTTGLGIDGQSTKPIFHMHTGTALCARDHERQHGFAVMDFDGDLLSVTSWIVDEPTVRFRARPTRTYQHRGGQWQRTDGTDGDPLPVSGLC